jgi:hypothetical protein
LLSLALVSALPSSTPFDALRAPKRNMDLVIDRAEPANAAVMLSPELQGDYAELRKLGIFDGIPNAELANAIRGGGVGRRVVERDAFVLDPIGLASGETAPIIFVAEGQIAAAVFEEHELSDRRAQQLRWQQMTDDERKEESLLKPPPLARTARKNVALFVPGDLFNSAALTSARGAPIAFYAAAPAVLCTIDHGTIAELATKHPFFEARFRRAIQLSRERLHRSSTSSSARASASPARWCACASSISASTASCARRRARSATARAA